MKVHTFFDEQAEASDSDDEEYDSAEDSPGSLAEFIVDDDLESKSDVRSLHSLLDSVSDSSDSQSVKKRKLIARVQMMKLSAKLKESVDVLWDQRIQRSFQRKMFYL